MPGVNLMARAANIVFATCLFANPILSGCAPTYTWENPQISPGDASRQFAIDQAECTAYGMNAVPVPDRTAAALPPPAVQHYRTTTTVIPGIDPYGNAFPMMIQTTESPQMLDVAKQSAEITENFQAIQDNARINKAYQVQDQLAEACMLQRGWQKVVQGG